MSLKKLTTLLEKHYGQKVVVLIDEYDVPLAKAYENNFYDKMVLLLRNLFGNVLKTNASLAFAVLTGCLRIAKESIFTGLNNFTVYSITDDEFDETFGFTSEEVQEMLSYYGLSSHFEEVKAWYDGYRFGTADVYCPWDVVYYCKDHQNNPNAEIKTILIDEAYTALGNGDRQKHDCLILEKVSEEAENADVIVLAQASMASALENSGLDTDKILTSPVLGIKKLKKILEENN